MTKSFILKVFRGESDHQYWQEFELELTPFLNMTSALMEVQKNPVTKENKKVTPIAWEQGCLEEVCGSCTMLINGRPRQGCSSLIEPLMNASGSRIITVAPLTKYPLVKDLVVNRDKLFESLMKVKAWIQVDDSLDKGFGPPINPDVQETRYTLSTCMTCACCQEACPQVNKHSKFIGPAPISQVRLFNTHPIGKMIKEERLRPLMDEGGVSECGNAQNCIQVCPKNIPLTESIALMGKEVTKQALKDLFSLPDAKE